MKLRLHQKSRSMNTLEEVIKFAIKIEHKSPNFFHIDKDLEFKSKKFNTIIFKYKINYSKLRIGKIMH